MPANLEVKPEPVRPGAPASATNLLVSGMSCSGCARNVVDALRGVPGVSNAEVQLEQGRAWVRWNPELPRDDAAVIAAVKVAGYEAELVPEFAEGNAHRPWSPFAGWQFNVVVGSVLTLPLFILEWILGVGMERWYHWLAFALVLPIQTFGGARFYRGAWNQLRAGSANMDTLVALGSTTAFLYSAWGLFAGWHGHLFFMESASIITLISIGHWLETKVSARAAQSLHALLDLAPATARLFRQDGAEVEVPIAQLRIGDEISIKPGDRIPIDCLVLEGTSTVDEAMLTGEPVPVEKVTGSLAYGGTVNVQGWLRCRVTATGEETALAQIIAVVQRAQGSRAAIQKLGDRVSAVFVPCVVLIALATGLWWGLAPDSALAASNWLGGWLWSAHHPAGPWAAAIHHAAAVLIVACPCAMGLATPIAIMAGTNAASELGILIRDGVALEKSGRITSILFDKTGTLTQGSPALVAAEEYLSSSEKRLDLKRVAASLARHSLHPLSQSVAALSVETWPTTQWQEIRGAGVQGRIDEASLSGRELRLGSWAWLRDQGIDLAKGAEFARVWSEKGATLLGLAGGAQLLLVMAFRDPLKANARSVIQSLQDQGLRVGLVTGDNRAAARTIAGQLGIDPANLFAEVRPDGKAALVEQLQTRGERVAFVGDGINDAPALEQSDLGIAVARASDVAREAADIILVNSDIQAVPEALALAQATLRTVKQNLFWAFFYNACGIPLAALGFLSPIFSAFAMGASDLIVIGNALRLRRWKDRPRRTSRQSMT